MQRPAFVTIPAILLAGLTLFGLSDTVISVDDMRLPDNEATTTVNKASISPPRATITITMYATNDE